MILLAVLNNYEYLTRDKDYNYYYILVKEDDSFIKKNIDISSLKHLIKNEGYKEI